MNRCRTRHFAGTRENSRHKGPGAEPELRAALSGGGELYHQPISALESDSWVRELSADYIETAGWLEGRCAPIDGGSYTLAFGDGEHQLSFVLRVGLADGVPPTSVSWRLNGLDAEAKWLPARARVAEVDDGPPHTGDIPEPRLAAQGRKANQRNTIAH